MIGRITFLLFFIAAWFMPLWPLLLVIGFIYLIAWGIPSRSREKNN
jgi:hypothetical protein